jgi:hypothetical protein
LKVDFRDTLRPKKSGTTVPAFPAWALGKEYPRLLFRNYHWGNRSERQTTTDWPTVVNEYK